MYIFKLAFIEMEAQSLEGTWNEINYYVTIPSKLLLMSMVKILGL